MCTRAAQHHPNQRPSPPRHLPYPRCPHDPLPHGDHKAPRRATPYRTALRRMPPSTSLIRARSLSSLSPSSPLLSSPLSPSFLSSPSLSPSFLSSSPFLSSPLSSSSPSSSSSRSHPATGAH